MCQKQKKKKKKKITLGFSANVNFSEFKKKHKSEKFLITRLYIVPDFKVHLIQFLSAPLITFFGNPTKEKNFFFKYHCLRALIFVRKSGLDFQEF